MRVPAREEEARVDDEDGVNTSQQEAHLAESRHHVDGNVPVLAGRSEHCEVLSTRGGDDHLCTMKLAPTEYYPRNLLLLPAAVADADAAAAAVNHTEILSNWIIFISQDHGVAQDVLARGAQEGAVAPADPSRQHGGAAAQPGAQELPRVHPEQPETNKIEAAIPELQEHCAEFQKEVADVVAKHGDIQFVFEHYLQLTELLEIPQLLEACIHNELFDSALDVIQFANETFQADENAESSRNVVIDCLVREVAEMASIMRGKLLQKLREDLQLALCVRIVGYLRRLDALVDKNANVGSSEYEKRLKEEFLTYRNVWLSSLSRGISSSDPYQYIDDFSSIATILEQCLFFGGSLGRVGVDFRAVLVVYFEDHVLNLMTEYWRSACREFQENLNAHSLSASSGSSFSASSKTPIVITSYRSSANGSSSNFPFASRQAVAGSSDGEDYSPPRCLMSFPLLAEFTNALLSSLNELRLCAISSLQNRLGKKYQSAIGTMLLTIADFVQENGINLHASSSENNSEGTATSTRNARAAALTDSVIRSDLVPYLIKCFHRLFPVPSAATLSAANAVSAEIEAFDEIMREAGLLVASPSDGTIKQGVEDNGEALEAAVSDAAPKVAGSIE
ncbi:unnamed protein product [Phytophthora lilii]|uniref:Conserved oligomeric Golgi complex subunit 8 n=1 Tax=Phytophthora lilii TaxID=2077276 RepID=A0A9W6TBZ9_9STRA|nr:unnamed protein product [Phytophthora lilii]